MKHWRETAEIADRVAVLASSGRGAAIATVIRIDGSSYRRPGAKLLIEDDGRTLGGVSGGCLEADVRGIALHVIATGTPQLLHYDTGADDHTVWGLGLGCNGSVDIFVQPATEPQTLRVIAEVRTRLDGGSTFGISTVVEGSSSLGRAIVIDEVGDARSRVETTDGCTVFTEVLHAPPSLVVCGAGDDARALVAYASDAGFAVTVADHRQAFLAAERFPSAKRLAHLRPDAAAGALAIDARTLAVVKTHSFAHDREWVRMFLKTPVSYVGLLGPRPRADQILDEIGVGARDPRVFAPVGLSLGADGPEQIAISVVGELLAVLARQQPGHLRERGQTIHAC